MWLSNGPPHSNAHCWPRADFSALQRVRFWSRLCLTCRGMLLHALWFPPGQHAVQCIKPYYSATRLERGKSILPRMIVSVANEKLLSFSCLVLRHLQNIRQSSGQNRVGDSHVSEVQVALPARTSCCVQKKTASASTYTCRSWHLPRPCEVLAVFVCTR